MKYFERILIPVMGLAVIPILVLGADSPTPVATHFNGNQLTQGNVQWYEKPAVTVGPVAGVTAPDGTLLTLQLGSSLYLEGDSTLHKYQMNAKAMEGSAVVQAPAAESLLKALQAGKVKAMTFLIPVKTLNSKDAGLDKNAYKALFFFFFFFLKPRTIPKSRFELTR